MLLCGTDAATMGELGREEADVGFFFSLVRSGVDGAKDDDVGERSGGRRGEEGDTEGGKTLPQEGRSREANIDSKDFSCR
ncbi:UNVERIFIED_CONTAM: hypothetical protein HHA_449910 [Hammondia hammondi]|eukprot:XP_008882592.1 hypothetical protein HHA_449910 [Hammondia hammondi]